MCKWMLPQIKTYPVECLTLRLVHSDGVAQTKWELSLLDHQSTPGQGEPEYDVREDKLPALHQHLHGDQMLADLSHNDLGVVHQPILDRDVYFTMHRQLSFNFNLCSGTPGDLREFRNSVDMRFCILVSTKLH